LTGGIALDIGTGDGSYAYKAARENTDKFYIGLDSNAENMQGFAQKAAKSAKKGGASNLLYAVANAEALPEELNGLISEVTIFFPWNSLLKAVATGDENFLLGLKRMLAQNASIKIVFSLDDTVEKKVLESLGVSSLNQPVLDKLEATYARAGFSTKWRMMSQDELKQFPTTWAKRLAYGRPRPCVEMTGRI